MKKVQEIEIQLDSKSPKMSAARKKEYQLYCLDRLQEALLASGIRLLLPVSPELNKAFLKMGERYMETKMAAAMEELPF